MTYFLLKLMGRLICLFPDSVNRRMGDLLGLFSWGLVPKRRKRMAAKNVRLSLQVNEITAWRIAKKSWTRFGRMITDVMSFPRIMKDIDRYVKIEGKENLDEALSYGRGAVIATAHSGNWEMMGAALAIHGYPLISVAKKQNNRQMDQLINEYRRMSGQHVTYKSGVREMVRFLGEGKIIGLLMDQDAGRDGIIFDFLGRKASWAQGAGFLGHMKNAPIVTGFIHTNPDGTHTLTLGKPLWVAQSGDKKQDIADMTQILIQKIEKHVRAYPEEWFWLHDRWKYANRSGFNDPKPAKK